VVHIHDTQAVQSKSGAAQRHVLRIFAVLIRWRHSLAEQVCAVATSPGLRPPHSLVSG
jgi:hypothetical protein